MRTPSSQKCRLDLAPPWADRFILGITPSIAARYFSAGPADSTSRWTPCPPKYRKRWLQVGLGCVQLSPSCPFRRLHTFRFLRPARLRTPLLGYGAPHLSARGTSTLLNNALLASYFLILTTGQQVKRQLVHGCENVPNLPWSFWGRKASDAVTRVRLREQTLHKAVCEIVPDSEGQIFHDAGPFILLQARVVRDACELLRGGDVSHGQTEFSFRHSL